MTAVMSKSYDGGAGAPASAARPLSTLGAAPKQPARALSTAQKILRLGASGSDDSDGSLLGGAAQDDDDDDSDFD